MTPIILFVSIGLLLSSVFARNPCGTPEWRYSPHNGKCYKLFDEQVDWTSGEFTCDFYGAHLVSIHNAADNQFVAELAKQAGTVWIGAAMFGGSRSYTYGDKSNFDFENWEGGFRPAYVRRNKCIHLDGQSGKWLQRCCTIDLTAFICQKDPIELPGEIIEEISPFDKAAIEKNTIDFRRRKFIRRL
uniref:C-type lectin domain-containing protein n=1 Tax=Acrobeloides nanus TaxID=290746 RepID=A0A914CFX6_9BILA